MILLISESKIIFFFLGEVIRNPLKNQIEVKLSLSGLREMEHSFSVEMKSKKYVRNISISDEDYNRVLLEGFLGELERISLIEGKMLEIKGSYGILRVDLSEEELQNMKTNSS